MKKAEKTFWLFLTIGALISALYIILTLGGL